MEPGTEGVEDTESKKEPCHRSFKHAVIFFNSRESRIFWNRHRFKLSALPCRGKGTSPPVLSTSSVCMSQGNLQCSLRCIQIPCKPKPQSVFPYHMVSLHLQYFIHFWVSHFKKDNHTLVYIQNRTISVVRRLSYHK